MRYTTIACLLAASYSAQAVEFEIQERAAAAELIDNDLLPRATPVPDIAQFELRQGQANLGATQAATQYPSVTTQWVESTIASTTTWVEIIYTQTFASFPGQLPLPGAGSIGYGTLTATGGKTKRDVVARATGLAGRIRT
jgi:hypothetical protein